MLLNELTQAKSVSWWHVPLIVHVTTWKFRLKIEISDRTEQFETNISQGATRNFTYLLEGQIHFALKLSVRCPIKQFWMLAGRIFLVSFGQHVFLQFHYKTIMLSKIANFQVRLSAK